MYSQLFPSSQRVEECKSYVPVGVENSSSVTPEEGDLVGKLAALVQGDNSKGTTA